MPIRVALHHITEYCYDRPVRLSPHLIRLRPAPHTRMPILDYSLKVTPEHSIHWQQDPFGNYLARFLFAEPTRVLQVTVDILTELTPVNPFDFYLEAGYESFPFTYDATLAKGLAPYLECCENGPRLMDWIRSVDLQPQPTVAFLVAMNQRLNQQIQYQLRLESGIQSCEETLELGSGSCRDSSWLLIQILRQLGLAARFVSGYLVQLTEQQTSAEEGALLRDTVDLHAWVEVYLPGAGWIGLDPTSGLLAGEGHLPLACTPDPASAAPISGTTDFCNARFSFQHRATRVQDIQTSEGFAITKLG